MVYSYQICASSEKIRFVFVRFVLNNFTFIVDDKIQNWTPGRVTFVDTAKMHYLFNAAFHPVYFIVLNVELNETTLKYVTHNLLHC